ncbi:phosphate/phosphite/phosphonate ABC transporter substrate-binding protein [Actinocorallia sp. A-T 12471]|uniref:phosphate/phosphite/phosphonate ABC transporter substrate-binding protein n=1 Tax=Actinocorallia sp. A-T 12471 TaxID=3089813 RepID=UPI0029CDE56C|nr:phosphate/phosphite/phosphonate ABC transporter substrate-binding protein [Actinocorallia sp. A-T 12471]MDX6741406.1 phosphate/phosphite/phosphonate ABC transporter substrate-binding protein [Actinocorallia sp. A-T 12471]
MKSLLRLTAVTALAVLPLLAACGGGESTTEASGGACPNGKVRFGVEPYEDPAKLKPAYGVLAKALEEKLGCPVELQVVEDYSAEVLAMRNGQLELAQFGPLGYVFASTKAGAEPLASFADASGALTTYTAGIWVPADSPIQSIADLKGKSLALSSAGSTSGDALPRYALAQAGIAEADVKLNYAGGHPEALLALTNGKVDSAEINSQQLATAEAAGQFDRSKFRQVWTSDPIPNDPITVASSLDPAFKKKVADALLGLDADAVAQVGAFLDVTPPGPLVAVTKDTYRPLFDLADKLGLTEKDV